MTFLPDSTCVDNGDHQVMRRREIHIFYQRICYLFITYPGTAISCTVSTISFRARDLSLRNVMLKGRKDMHTGNTKCCAFLLTTFFLYFCYWASLSYVSVRRLCCSGTHQLRLLLKVRIRNVSLSLTTFLSFRFFLPLNQTRIKGGSVNMKDVFLLFLYRYSCLQLENALILP